MKNPLLGAGCAMILLTVTGCVTHIKTDITQNPPPAEKFANFGRVELRPIILAAPFAGQSANQKALKKIQEDVSKTMKPTLTQWNVAAASNPEPRTLVIEPTVTQIKFINGTVRFWTGPFSGSSAVILNAKIYDKATGAVIATPEFYARGEAMAGGFTIGSTDNLMLLRISNRLTNYLQANYTRALGGPTGLEPPKS